jgi:membrane protein DedA with SNARE-associated domain
MFGDITQFIIEAIKSHGVIAVVLGVIIETVIVPLPSPLILMTAGYLLIPKGTALEIILAAFWISLVAGVAQTIGSYLLYYIGYYGGKPVIDRTDRFTGVSWKDIAGFEKKFRNKNEVYTIAFLRALPIMPLSVVSGVAGLLKVDFKRYTLATFMGVVPRNFALAMSGFIFSSFYETIATKIDHAESIVTIIIVALIVAYILMKRFGLIDRIRQKVF